MAVPWAPVYTPGMGQRKPGSIPAFVTCSNPNCRRRIDPLYDQGMPDADSDPTRVTYVEDGYGMIFGVFCPCGHYTVWGPLEWVQRREELRKQLLS